jgi:hypothetical protein
MLISTLDKVIYYIGTFLQGSTKPLFTTKKAGNELKKFAPFSKFFFQGSSYDFYDPHISF